ncbi:MAG: formate/nitrite transporter FocA (FNT family) [Cyclobacteriaceae bacterium]|jgi:formate/nitrite transporter FocA (FNT family)
MHLLKQIAYFGGILLAILGLVLMLIVNETGESSVLLVKIMTSIIFISGLSLLVVMLKGGLKN